MLKERIKNKEKLIGSYIELCDPTIARILALAGYDFIWVDTEHSPMTTETLLEHVRTLRLSGTPAIVRVPQGELTFTKRTLEMGIDGIIIQDLGLARLLHEKIPKLTYAFYILNYLKSIDVLFIYK